MSTPLIILVVLTAMGLGVSLARSVKEKTGTENFTTSLISAIISWSLIVWALKDAAGQ